MTIRFSVNGEERSVEADESMPLLWALRDLLGLRGAKYGCGIAACGVCTVHLDGSAVRSCVLPLSAVEGKRVTTVEGLGGNHPLQRAWVDEQVPQCGYCQPGQIMQAAALLASNPNPTREQVREAMNSVLCRCGTYLRIESAVRRAAEVMRNKEASHD
ncbi:MAG: (2Fe-2S)-binding protein [Gammaproteobacteria bacterium]|nr:(2Fe-2S)-binding protein [Gammaproteobacteria bacterium]